MKILDKINNSTPEPVSDINTADSKVSLRIKSAIDYLKSKYDFLYNIVTADIEYKRKNEKEYRIFDDRTFSTVVIELGLQGYKVSDNELKNIIHSDYVSVLFHPFRHYFDRIGKCESKYEYNQGNFIKVLEGRDYIKEFCQQIYLKDETLRNYLVEGFRKWFVGLVVSIYDDDISLYKINQICFILVGAQSKYKTTFFEHIVPAHLRTEYFYSGSFNFHDKDNEKRMATKIVMSMEEMASYTKTDIEIVKAKITQPRVVVRPAFYRRDLRLKRRASFCGTQNNKQFLKDETGSRRFFVVDIERIVIDAEFPIDKMYAQGLQHLRDGYKYWFDENDVTEVEGVNEKYQLRSFEYELVMTNYVKPDNHYDPNDIKYLTATDIAIKLAEDKKINVNNTVINNIGKALSSLGFEKVIKKINKKPVYVWKVVEKNTVDNYDVL